MSLLFAAGKVMVFSIFYFQGRAELLVVHQQARFCFVLCFFLVVLSRFVLRSLFSLGECLHTLGWQLDRSVGGVNVHTSIPPTYSCPNFRVLLRNASKLRDTHPDFRRQRIAGSAPNPDFQ